MRVITATISLLFSDLDLGSPHLRTDHSESSDDLASEGRLVTRMVPPPTLPNARRTDEQ